MTFFSDQQNARTRTRLLLYLYVMSVLIILLVTYLSMVYFFVGEFDFEKWAHLHVEKGLWHPKLLMVVSVGVLGMIGFGTVSRIFELDGGGGVVAAALGGRLITLDTKVQQERQLLNVVEETAIASGIRIPEVYILEEETGINAFAAGFQPGSAVIGVSKGCLTYLTRDELQGVIAHEFSHILNGDMRLNIRLTGMLYGINMLTLFGRKLACYKKDANGEYKMTKGHGLFYLLFLAIPFLTIGFIGTICARLIKMAVSRQREYLADASAVQFTRNPEGITGALIKIGGLKEGSKLSAPFAEEFNHLCIADPLTGLFGFEPLFTSHPPLRNRIQRIKPSFNGQFPVVEALQFDKTENSGVTDHEQIKETHGPSTSLSKSNFSNAVGTITSSALAASRNILETIPENVLQSIHDPLNSAALLCTLLVSEDKLTRERQLACLSPILPEPIAKLLPENLAKALVISSPQRLAVVDLGIASLRRLQEAQYIRFRSGLDSLIQGESTLAVHQFALYHTIVKTLDEHFKVYRKRTKECRDLGRILSPTSKLIFALAHYGHSNAATAQEAYIATCDKLEINQKVRLPVGAKDNISGQFISEALGNIENIAPDIREQIFAACISCVLHDEFANTAELELVRAIGLILDCPVPQTVQ